MRVSLSRNNLLIRQNMDFNLREQQDGIRFSWNYWPNTKVGATRVTIPVGALYTPLKQIEGSQPVEYPPIACKQCQSILNPYCNLDFKFKTWACSICNTVNNFPPHYANHISPETLPFELMNDYSTIEYVVPTPPQQQVSNPRPIFMLVVDTAISSEELVELKDSLQ